MKTGIYAAPSVKGLNAVASSLLRSKVAMLVNPYPAEMSALISIHLKLELLKTKNIRDGQWRELAYISLVYFINRSENPLDHPSYLPPKFGGQIVLYQPSDDEILNQMAAAIINTY